eukprot:354728-Chlamydomonas_euryale.AAC.2
MRLLRARGLTTDRRPRKERRDPGLGMLGLAPPLSRAAQLLSGCPWKGEGQKGAQAPHCSLEAAPCHTRDIHTPHTARTFHARRFRQLAPGSSRRGLMSAGPRRICAEGGAEKLPILWYRLNLLSPNTHAILRRLIIIPGAFVLLVQGLHNTRPMTPSHTTCRPPPQKTPHDAPRIPCRAPTFHDHQAEHN